MAPLAAIETTSPRESGPERDTSGEDNGGPMFDETAESAYLADARDRGEAAVVPSTAALTEAEEGGGQALPRLEELVNRIPAGVRETLDDLFRARFVTVKRFPKKALKG